MGEKGWLLWEGIFTLCLFSLLVSLAPFFLQIMGSSREMQEMESEAQFIAQSFIEEWKGGGQPVSGDWKSEKGVGFHVVVSISSLSPSVEECEVEIHWQLPREGSQSRKIQGYRLKKKVMGG